MTRLCLFALLGLLFSAAPLHAADDGGFGSERFYNDTPIALDDNDNLVTTVPGDIEPAAGIENELENVPGFSTEELRESEKNNRNDERNVPADSRQDEDR